tara:strand:+ start:781 stop:966 length:186 start_codon:yes stop_codon:yes gene_type:complete
MAKFNHAFDIAFSLTSETEDGSDVDEQALYEALLLRIEGCRENGDLVECCGAPFDTYIEEK